MAECGRDAVTLHSYGDIVPDFEMKVSGVHSEIAADGAQLLASFQILANLDHDFIEVAV